MWSAFQLPLALSDCYELVIGDFRITWSCAGTVVRSVSIQNSQDVQVGPPVTKVNIDTSVLRQVARDQLRSTRRTLPQLCDVLGVISVHGVSQQQAAASSASQQPAVPNARQQQDTVPSTSQQRAVPRGSSLQRTALSGSQHESQAAIVAQRTPPMLLLIAESTSASSSITQSGNWGSEFWNSWRNRKKSDVYGDGMKLQILQDAYSESTFVWGKCLC